MRTVCVYTKEFALSAEKARRCVKSGDECGIDVELYPSVYFKNVIEEANTLDLKLRYKPHNRNSTDFKNMTAPASRIANGITHYKLYKWSVENKKPICIVEHDSVFVGKPPEAIWNGIIQISSHNTYQLTAEKMYNCNRAEKMKKYEPGRIYNWNWPVEGVMVHPLSGQNGTSGYIVGPGAAQKMVEYIESSGVAFADRVRTEHIGEGNLYLQVPQSVFCMCDIETARMM